MVQIITTIIASGCTLIGVVLTVMATSRKSATVMETRLAVIDERVASLTSEVKEHNEYGRKIPVLMEQIQQLERRIERLEKGA